MKEGDDCEPHYDLDRIKHLIRLGRWVNTQTVVADLLVLKWETSDMLECVLALERSDFYKSSPSHIMPGMWHDIYRHRHRGILIYTKLQITETATTVIISFRRK